MKRFLATILLALSTAVWAAPSAGSSAGTGFISTDDYPRTLIFEDPRIWQTTDGHVLVCPFDAEGGWNHVCETKKSRYAWVSIEDIKIPGFELAGYSTAWTGSSGYQHLVLHFRKIRPPAVTAPVTPVALPPAPTVLNIGTLTVNTQRVLVQRRKH